MELIAALRNEHTLIDQVAGSLRRFAAARLAEAGARVQLGRFVRFFEVFSAGFHHAREEDTLFAALAGKADAPADRGPIAVMVADHHEMGRLRERLAELAALPAWDGEARREVEELAAAFSRLLWAHIDAENSVLFPEAEVMLRRAGVTALAGRAMSEEEAAAEAEGRELVRLYPPLADPEVMRGEGCVACPAYLERCGGVEREWWTDLDWEEFTPPSW